jgi:ElaB/YqjD/DUF883 family membrane-anchored ribosome-binding protein
MNHSRSPQSPGDGVTVRKKTETMQGSKRAKKTIHNSVDDIRDHARGMTGNLSEAVKDVFIEKLTDMLRRAVSLGDRGQQATRDAATEVRDELEEKTQAPPYKAVLIAAGVGLLLGFLLRRR